jgi:UDP-N-acetylmuramoyl-tripeptide--D-alanyl-D-alanine ligase
MEARRKIVVAGDMLELGTQAVELHRTLGRQIAAIGIHQLLTVGPLASIAADAAVESGLDAARWIDCATPEAAAEALRATLSDGDAVLIKGSHGVHLERCVERVLSGATCQFNGIL